MNLSLVSLSLERLNRSASESHNTRPRPTRLLNQSQNQLRRCGPPQLEYATTARDTTNDKQRLESIQRSAARFVLGDYRAQVSHSTHSTRELSRIERPPTGGCYGEDGALLPERGPPFTTRFNSRRTHSVTSLCIKLSVWFQWILGSINTEDKLKKLYDRGNKREIYRYNYRYTIVTALWLVFWAETVLLPTQRSRPQTDYLRLPSELPHAAAPGNKCSFSRINTQHIPYSRGYIR